MTSLGNLRQHQSGTCRFDVGSSQYPCYVAKKGEMGIIRIINLFLLENEGVCIVDVEKKLPTLKTMSETVSHKGLEKV